MQTHSASDALSRDSPSEDSQTGWEQNPDAREIHEAHEDRENNETGEDHENGHQLSESYSRKEC